jgi:hypothetical protein
MHHRESSILRGIPIPVKLGGKILEQQQRSLWESLLAQANSDALPERKTGADSSEPAPALVGCFG